MAETTFTFFDSDEVEKTALAGANGSGHLVPAAVLYAIDGTQLIGQKARAASLPTTLSTEDITALTPPAAITGFSTETTAAAILAKLLSAPATEAKQDAGNTSLVSIDTKLSTQAGYLDGLEAAVGATNDSAAGTDTATSGLIGLSKRLLQRVTTLLAVFPTTIDTNSGNKSASTLRVVLATDQPALTNPLDVVGSSITVTPTHTVDTAVYAAGDTVGTIITIANAFRASGRESILQSIHILDRANQKPTGNLLFFNASPSAATTTDNAAFVYSTDDLKEVARVPIVTADYATVNSKATAHLSNLGRQVYATTGTSLFMVFVTDGTPDFVNTTDLQITYSFLRD